ncbi:MAG: hypothetical protein HGA35_03255, partial [Erysipelotrichaceae bacterium]|nr:hypothetical protein [Erysipelotrichaceae bacterium]
YVFKILNRTKGPITIKTKPKNLFHKSVDTTIKEMGSFSIFLKEDYYSKYHGLLITHFFGEFSIESRNGIKINTFDINTQIKWTNYLIIDQKKFAGILIETQTLYSKYSSLIVGFGLNIYKQDFDDALKLIATTLEDHKFQEYDRNKFLINFFNLLDLFLFHQDIISYFKKHMIPIGSYVYMTLNNNKEIVKILDLNDNGQLVIETKNKDILTLFNEEISL